MVGVKAAASRWYQAVTINAYPPPGARHLEVEGEGGGVRDDSVDADDAPPQRGLLFPSRLRRRGYALVGREVAVRRDGQGQDYALFLQGPKWREARQQPPTPIKATSVAYSREGAPTALGL